MTHIMYFGNSQNVVENVLSVFLTNLRLIEGQ